jgi:acyl carrier protein
MESVTFGKSDSGLLGSGRMNENTISPQIQAFIVRTFPAARRRMIDENLHLLEAGIIDSLGVLDVVEFLEKSFTIKISDEELTPDNFATIRSLAAFVEKKKNQVELAAG